SATRRATTRKIASLAAENTHGHDHASVPCSRHDAVLIFGNRMFGVERARRPGVARARVGKPMFHFFERTLKPTAVRETAEPPPGLVAFYWHFARQAKPLFIGLFAVGFA